MSDVTDINALIERLDEAIAAIEADMIADAEDAQTTGERPDLWDYEVSLSPSDARDILAALRTLAERQPVGDGEVTQADREALRPYYERQGYPPNMIAHLMKLGSDLTKWELPAIFARHRQAAEQRGADRAFEEAAGIVEAFGDWPSKRRWVPRAEVVAVIRQRIGGPALKETNNG